QSGEHDRITTGRVGSTHRVPLNALENDCSLAQCVTEHVSVKDLTPHRYVYWARAEMRESNRLIPRDTTSL
ncbi:hypothetical protein U0070_023912, partial [Myodes glareolus]